MVIQHNKNTNKNIKNVRACAQEISDHLVL